MNPSLPCYLKVESDEIDSPNSEIIKSQIIDGRSRRSYLPVSHDGIINKYFLDVTGHEVGGPTTILWISNLCMQMGKFYAPGLFPHVDDATATECNDSSTPRKSAVKFFEFKKPSFLITPHHAGHNYFHFMIDSLPRFSFKQKFAIFSMPILFSGLKSYFQCDSMNILLRKNYPIYDISNRVLLRECALTWPLPRTAAVDFLRKKSARVRADNDSKRIYVSRRKSTYRRIINEVDLEHILEKLGFLIIECEDLEFNKQVSLFKGAEIICGPHGAGLTNIAFCHENASVLEIIMEERLSINVGSAFWELACAAELDYHILTAQRVVIDQENPHDGAMYVNPEKFEAALQHLIDHRRRS